MYLGEDGYLKAASAIMAVADDIKKGVEEIPELTLVGDATFVISFVSHAVDVFHVNDFMQTKGWRFNCLQLPPGMHFCVTMPQTVVPDVAAHLIQDLKAGVAYAKANAGKVAETTALYGLGGESGRQPADHRPGVRVPGLSVRSVRGSLNFRCLPSRQGIRRL